MELYHEGQLRVWWIRNFPAEPTYYYVATAEEAIEKINALADRDLEDETIWGNAGGLEVHESGEWVTWYSADGEDIDEYAERISGE